MVARWLAWSLCLLLLVMIAFAVVLAAMNGYGLVNVSFLFPVASAALVGGLVASRRPKNPIGWFILGHAMFFTVGEFSRQYAIYGVLTEPGSLPLARAMASPPYWVWFPGIILGYCLLPLYFPNGRLLSKRWRPVVWLAIFAAVIPSSLAAVVPLDVETPGIPNPLGIEGLQPLIDRLEVILLMWVGLGVAAMASLVVRFRRSGETERQQIKWVVYAVVFLALFSVVDVSLQEFFGGFLPALLDEISNLVILSGLWAAIAVAIIKYRLYDIDRIINRTLVYVMLTISLGLIYLGGVVALQGIFRSLTGQGSQLAIVASTLVVATLFNPLRRRLQSFIDRRFYRRKYDARKTLEAFSYRLRDQTDLQALNGELVGAVRDTMQPEHVTLWLRPDPAPETNESYRGSQRAP